MGSAFNPKADVNYNAAARPLLAITRHSAARPKSKIGCTENPPENAIYPLAEPSLSVVAALDGCAVWKRIIKAINMILAEKAPPG